MSSCVVCIREFCVVVVCVCVRDEIVRLLTTYVLKKITGMSVAVVFHHEGEFVKDFLLYYKGGKENRFNEIDKDKWCYFEAIGILKDLGYDDHLKYRLLLYIIEDDKYVRIIDDNDTDNIAEYVANTKCEAHIYVEHSVIGTTSADVGVRSVESVDASGVEAGNGWSSYVEGGPSNVSVGVDDGGVGDDEVFDGGFESSEDEVVGIRLDGSEEERALGLDDGFGGDVEDAPPATRTNGPSLFQLNPTPVRHLRQLSKTMKWT